MRARRIVCWDRAPSYLLKVPVVRELREALVHLFETCRVAVAICGGVAPRVVVGI